MEFVSITATLKCAEFSADQMLADGKPSRTRVAHDLIRAKLAAFAVNRQRLQVPSKNVHKTHISGYLFSGVDDSFFFVI